MFIRYIPVTQSSPRDGHAADTVLIHWTGGTGDAEAAARYFNNLHEFGEDEPRKPNGSYHGTIGRDGAMVQMVELDRAAWHAGDGDGHLWDGPVPPPRPGRRVNLRSVGLALCNRGPLDVASGGVAARHDKPGVRWPAFEPYPDAQIWALKTWLAELVTRLPTLRWICGHEDITAGKADPGPLFPWDELSLADLGLQRVRRRWLSGLWEVL